MAGHPANDAQRVTCVGATPSPDAHELDRLRALKAYGLLDSGPDRRFTELAAAAAALLGTTKAAITLVDAERLWSLAAHGGGLQQSPRTGSLAAPVISAAAAVVISDLHDPRYRALAAAAGPIVRSFAGVPLIGRDGLPLGVLSVCDSEPRAFSEAELSTLEALADTTVAVMEGHRNDAETGRAARPPLSLNVATSNFSAAGVRDALRRREFEVYYQPIVSLPSGRLVAVEALARWNMPGVGLIAPQFFLPHIEASPLLSQSFTEYVLGSACAALGRWHTLGAESLRVSVNVSGYEVTGGCLPAMVRRAVRSAAIPYELLTLEITETVHLRDRELAIDHLGRVRDLGVRVTLDDFGVGYSSLENAGLLPITGLKLDREFIANLMKSAATRATLASVVQLCKSLNLELVGEGVEHQEAADLLVHAGVELAQGYFYSRPVAEDQITTMLVGFRSAAAILAIAGPTVLKMPMLPGPASVRPVMLEHAMPA